ncbi:hypothetical protein [Ralstonia insidiosa]|uniref:Uncharacterized protein n=1 Tax=Ralstonia insidiosa TaxID=190721 RepID=A0A848P4V0_9RALS|nr:hypothetical protein [Ralstonia insidiosa]NMV39656.1 hypothetical protein [Ralstonia insidiosa]
MKTNSQYLRSFNDAMARSQGNNWPELNAQLNVDPAQALDLQAIRKAVADHFSVDYVSDTWELAGRCFLVAREMSYVLFGLRIPHAVTIGNVQLDGQPYFTTTLESLAKEFSDGYVGNTPANAHCWLTLADGSILDGSLLPSISHREGASESLSFHDAIFIKRHDFVDRLEYLPYLTGLHYHFEVVTHEFLDRYFETYAQWVDDYCACARAPWWRNR